MIQIRPVTDLRDKLDEIESTVQSGQPVYLTRDGYGAMVVMRLEDYETPNGTDYIDSKLAEADRLAAANPKRYTHDEIFTKLRARLS